MTLPTSTTESSREEEMPLETTPPLTMDGYARKFSSLFARDSNEYETKTAIAKKVICEWGLDKEPVTMLSIGAGRGNFELMMVQKLGLKLKWIYLVEPNPEHVKQLKTAFEGIGCDYEVDTSFFSKDFQLSIKNKESFSGFDFILMSHSLYCIPEPFKAAVHAASFLNSKGKLFIINHGGAGSAQVFSYLLKRSEPSVFSHENCLANHAVTAHEISSYIKSACPEFSVVSIEKPTYTDMDDFVRADDDDTRNDDVISFFLQAEYRDLSLRGRRDLHEIVKAGCDLVNGRYRMRHTCVGIVVSRILASL